MLAIATALTKRWKRNVFVKLCSIATALTKFVGGEVRACFVVSADSASITSDLFPAISCEASGAMVMVMDVIVRAVLRKEKRLITSRYRSFINEEQYSSRL